ncbi:Squalene/phytoene synthase,Isoprenoid synthase domain [Cinara cedri]|uniref:Squalene/phytoene synthase,Isoprenoid synthase domain n=1 Tax=Cinara cedri TaxID=506608 RepID=A0A5E4NGG3_9HEMI|nr:Squalene/phytoene synthase,Isoprenoid synthase domain [Cinara cedri]
MTALVRLQWWREIISIIYRNKAVNDNPIILELANVIYSCTIPEFLINDYLDGYEQMVYQPFYRNTPNLEKIAAQTTVTLIKMLFTIIIQNYSNDQLAYHCGVAWHLMNILRGTATEQLDEETMVSIVERTEYHINQVKKLIKTVPKEIVKITLQTRLAGLYLKRIRNKKSDFTNGKIGVISPIMQIKMLFYYFFI